MRDSVEKHVAEAEAVPPANINLLVDYVLTGEVRRRFFLLIISSGLLD